MRIIRSTSALIGRLGFGFLALGAMSQPLRNGVPTQAIPPPAAQGLSARQTSPDWTLEVDEASLGRQLNGWAAEQAQVQTPFGMAQLEDLTVKLGDDRIALHATAQAAWVRAPVDLVASAAVRDGRVNIELPQAHVNGVEVPEVVRHEVAQQLQDQLDRSVMAQHVVVRSVRADAGTLVVSGTRQ